MVDILHVPFTVRERQMIRERMAGLLSVASSNLRHDSMIDADSLLYWRDVHELCGIILEKLREPSVKPQQG